MHLFVFSSPPETYRVQPDSPVIYSDSVWAYQFTQKPLLTHVVLTQPGGYGKTIILK